MKCARKTKAAQVAERNKNRVISDEWQFLLDSGKLEEVGNDTRFIYFSRLVSLRRRGNTHNYTDACNTY